MGDRAKGYMNWSPTPKSLVLLEQVKEVLDVNRADLPITARTIFYNLVGLFSYDKTEKAYANLCELLVKARRAQMLPFHVINDESLSEQGGDWGYTGPEQFWDQLRESGQGYSRFAREGQPNRIELWCETVSMVPMLAGAVEAYGVRVRGTGGFSGVTATYDFAQRVVADSRPTIFLHLGDYDPSGEAIYDSIKADVFAFVAGEIGLPAARERFIPERIGLTWEQVVEHGIETAPPKRSDKRSARWEDEGRHESAQLEAVPGPLRKEWAREACERHTDMSMLAEVEERGDNERERILTGMDRLFENFDEEAD